ncbi:hypothetical protein AZE42_13448 [Rhizopogon vesiculosus]|uniref:Uncharacterized protein n=1 Tax=Rhizopogon vesiculosus TaxID=180088 RepID=A0A1J8Q317_9AGAM|nr:hypothetical protein AZE42_13448 [Rhizopogon vesiculosus]
MLPSSYIVNQFSESYMLP